MLGRPCAVSIPLPFTAQPNHPPRPRSAGGRRSGPAASSSSPAAAAAAAAADGGGRTAGAPKRPGGRRGPCRRCRRCRCPSSLRVCRATVMGQSVGRYVCPLSFSHAVDLSPVARVRQQSIDTHTSCHTRHTHTHTQRKHDPTHTHTTHVNSARTYRAGKGDTAWSGRRSRRSRRRSRRRPTGWCGPTWGRRRRRGAAAGGDSPGDRTAGRRAGRRGRAGGCWLSVCVGRGGGWDECMLAKHVNMQTRIQRPQRALFLPFVPKPAIHHSARTAASRLRRRHTPPPY